MTIEEKIKKLNSICDEKILVWTKDKKEDLEFCEFINEHYNMRYDLDGVKSSYYYVEEIEEDGEYLEGEIVVTFSTDCYGYTVIPYSEFFSDDKVKQSTSKDDNTFLVDWTIGEIIEHYNNRCEDYRCEDCPIQRICDISEISDWDFIPSVSTPSLTQSEIDILKAIKVLSQHKKLAYNKSIDGFESGYIKVKPDRLPSLSHDKEYSIDELLKED